MKVRKHDTEQSTAIKKKVCAEELSVALAGKGSRSEQASVTMDRV